MCGILGGFSPAPMQHADIERALNKMQHRGPDDSGIKVFQRHFIGMRRLAIIDRNEGYQPLANEDKSLWVVQNGEIYNYLELRQELIAAGHQFRTHSDTEVLVHLYEEEGEAMVRRLRGMFAFCIYDSREDSMFLARDRFGKKPLFIATRGKKFWFSSELKSLISLMESAGERVSIEQQGIYDFLTLGSVPQPTTVFEGVYCVPPASTLRIDCQGQVSKKYWESSSCTPRMENREEVLEQVRTKIGEAVRIRLRSDVPLGVLLSGGVDSSIIAYEAAKELGSDLHTFTVGTSESDLDESAVASRTAKRLGVRNTRLTLDVAPVDALHFIVQHYDQPYADSSAIPSYAVCKKAGEHVTVLLNGDGGDELFAGYRRYLAAAAADKVSFIPRCVFNGAAHLLAALPFDRRGKMGFLKRFVRGMGQDSVGRYLVWTLDMLREVDKAPVWKGSNTRPTEDLIASSILSEQSLIRQLLSSDRELILLSDLLVKMDMASMAASVEARSPFMDHELAELAINIPDSYLFHGGKTKSVLRDAYAGRLSSEVLSGAKRGFEIPMSRWLDEDFSDLLSDTVLTPSAEINGYLDSDFVRSIYRGNFQERNTTYIRYSLLVLELWLRWFKSK